MNTIVPINKLKSRLLQMPRQKIIYHAWMSIYIYIMHYRVFMSQDNHSNFVFGNVF